MPLYYATVFASAFLLLLVQPVISKQILPWFGGSASVWTTCLVFFQTALLAGYFYVDLTVRHLAPRRQLLLHAMLLIVSLAVLPIIPSAHWKPGGAEAPAWLILALLTASIGLPYLLLSTTSPLVQAWATRSHPGTDPYPLYALSNGASMLALVGYPFLIEPWSPTARQAVGWSAGYALFVALCVAAAWRSRSSAPPVPAAAPPVADGTPPSAARQALWCSLAAAGSILLLAATNQITRNIAAVPLLWIVPLSAYLLSFILAFAGWYRRAWIMPAAAVAIVVMSLPRAYVELLRGPGAEIGMLVAGLFITCLFAHGELAALKPAPRHLTRYYLMLSLGGAAGSVLVGIGAPLLLPGYFELPVGLVLCASLLYLQLRARPLLLRGAAAATIAAAVIGAAITVNDAYKNVRYLARDFYGVLRVEQRGSGGGAWRLLFNGTIVHGMQFLGRAQSALPTTYYTPTAGIGRLLTLLGRGPTPLRVGVIGLGAGTLAAYGRAGDTYRFYEIDSQVIAVAREQFSYLRSSAATIETALGDARLSLEREPPQQFDVLAIDAFSSDAIPVHLLTAEALAIYRKHMKPGGIIAFHVTNRFLNLVPVVERLAEAQGMHAVLVVDDGETPLGSLSDWVLLSDSKAALEVPQISEVAKPIDSNPDQKLWTDDFNNIVQVLKRN
jgi:SAM-dependent methyltransferase